MKWDLLVKALMSNATLGTLKPGAEAETHMVLVKPKVVDSTRLELSRPIPTEHGRTVVVSVAEVGERDADRRQWLAVSAATLQSAYGEPEPDYPRSVVRENNLRLGEKRTRMGDTWRFG